MNILAAVALDLATNLKRLTTGWQISSLVTECDKNRHHNCSIMVKNIPPGVSPLNFYLENQPHLESTYLRIKIQKKPLRIISLANDQDGIINLGFWRANGYIRLQESHKRHFSRWGGTTDIKHGYNCLHLHSLHHVRTTNKGLVYIDYQIKPEEPNSNDELLLSIIKVITTSLTKKEDFSFSTEPMLIDFTRGVLHGRERHAPIR